MPWVKFTRKWEFRHKRRVIQPFIPGDVRLVTTRCALAALAVGAGVIVEKPANAYRPRS